jgi:hypothetical protein
VSSEETEDYYYHGTQPGRMATIRKSGLHTEMNHFDRRWKQALQRGSELLRVHHRHMPKDTMFDADRIHAYTRSLIRPSFIEMHQAGHWVRISNVQVISGPPPEKPAPSLLELGTAFFRGKRA